MRKILAVLCVALLLLGMATTFGCTKKKTATRKTPKKIETKKVRVGDIDISYRMFGQGYPLVLIMGFSGTMDIWDSKVLKELSARYKVLIFDNRGMGETTAPPGDFSIRQFADDTAGLMDALKIKHAHVLGWSMGSYIAQELVLNRPDKVNKLVLYATDCQGSQAIQPRPEILNKLYGISSDTEEIEKERFELLFPEQWLKKHPDFYKKFPRPKEPVNLKNIARQIKAMGQFSSYDRLPQIKRPTLIITGTEDVLTPSANSQILVNRIPGAQLVQFKGGGHGLMYQYPDKFTRTLIDFLE